ncbi:hypothetical protein BDZ91DRAFT_285781 [Kalaharituber pfeilii]|nr:hypothetical protein BDZ91DRAFT_285781 [Kalaharituber pfeilii]
MDPDAISRQARAAIDSLTLQLEALQNQQSALLTSLHLTTTTLSTLPFYSRIAPTLSQIPAYEAKLSRLRNTMNAQSLEVAQLRRRVEEAKRARIRNLERIRERRERERERDRTVLKARMVGVGGGQTMVGGKQEQKQLAEQEQLEHQLGSPAGAGGATGEDIVASLAPPGTPVSMSSQSIQEPIKTIKRKKKARQADIQ